MSIQWTVTGALVCCFFRKGAQEKGGGDVCLCVGGACLYVCVWGGGVCHIQRLTNLLFSQDLYKKNRTTSRRQLCALLYYFGPNPISFSFFGLCWIFRLNVGVPLFDKVKKLFENQLTNKRLTICKRIYVEQQISIRGNATRGLLSNNFTILTRKHMCWICMPYGLQLYLKETPNIFL